MHCRRFTTFTTQKRTEITLSSRLQLMSGSRKSVHQPGGDGPKNTIWPTTANRSQMTRTSPGFLCESHTSHSTIHLACLCGDLLKTDHHFASFTVLGFGVD